MNSVAFLGTGLLGAGMVERMLAQGNSVTVWNRTQSKAQALQQMGAVVAETAGDAVAAADHVHLALTDDAVVDAVLLEVIPRLRREAIVMDHSTTSPSATQARVDRLTRAGVRFLHAPVFMSPQMCREGKGLMMVSGRSDTFDAVQPALVRMTGDVWYVGERSDLAAAYKLFGNSMIFAINAGLSDVLAMATNLEIPGRDAVGLFSRFNTSLAIPMRGQKMATGDFSAMFELVMARKDLRLMIEAAGHQPLIVLPALAARMDAVIADGHGSDDFAAIAAPVVSPV
ncbi:MAG: NAD(P)-dependent oxidoreductase [Blastocatellia bacterium]|nr:MAG: NAD(P)-dependent oxidoreductase [Blastocatellia bacterium]